MLPTSARTFGPCERQSASVARQRTRSVADIQAFPL